MIDNVEQGPYQAERVSQPDAEPDVADLADAAVGQHASKIALRNRHDRAIKDSRCTQPCNDGSHGQDITQVMGLENRQKHADQRVGGH